MRSNGPGVVDATHSEGRHLALWQAWPLVERLETMTQELMRLAGGLSLEALRQLAVAFGDRQPAEQSSLILLACCWGQKVASAG
jgi:hypothetical protein